MGANPLFCGSKKKAPPVVRERHTTGVLASPLRCLALGCRCPWLRVRVAVGLTVGACCWSCRAALLKRRAAAALLASYCRACVVLSAGAVCRPNRNRNRWRGQLPVHSETAGHELPAGGGGSGSTFWAGAGPCRSGRRLVGVRGHFAPGLGTTPKQGSAGSRCGGISLRLIA